MEYVSGIIGAILGSLIVIFGNEIKRILIRIPKNDPISGSWECVWSDYDSPNDEIDSLLIDRIDLKLISNDRIEGIGNNPDY